MSTVLITGGSGLIGNALTKLLLEKGFEVIIFTRNPEKQKPVSAKLSYAQWNIDEQMIDKAALAKADHIIHLAGAGIADKRWSKKRKKEILESRTKSSDLIVDSLKNVPNKVKTVVSASGIGWYGQDPVIPNPKAFAEDSPASNDFLGNTCRQWEESIEPVTQLGKRLVKLRTGIVLSIDGGALKKFMKPLKFGVATILGNGKQIISWIHIDDLARVFLSAIENNRMIGVYNAVTSNPVSNKELVIQLAKSRKKLFIPFHVPTFMLKLILGEMSIEVLKSATVSNEKILKAGFNFQFPGIAEALGNAE